jgi:hypothetical protein
MCRPDSPPARFDCLGDSPVSTLLPGFGGFQTDLTFSISIFKQVARPLHAFESFLRGRTPHAGRFLGRDEIVGYEDAPSTLQWGDIRTGGEDGCKARI